MMPKRRTCSFGNSRYVTPFPRWGCRAPEGQCEDRYCKGSSGAEALALLSASRSHPCDLIPNFLWSTTLLCSNCHEYVRIALIQGGCTT